MNNQSSQPQKNQEYKTHSSVWLQTWLQMPRAIFICEKPFLKQLDRGREREGSGEGMALVYKQSNRMVDRNPAAYMLHENNSDICESENSQS